MVANYNAGIFDKGKCWHFPNDNAGIFVNDNASIFDSVSIADHISYWIMN